MSVVIEKKFAVQFGYTDVRPLEVVRVVSEKCVEVRYMEAQLDPTWKPEMIVGGFAAHTVNNHDQKWIITSDPTNPVFKIRLGKKGWKNKYGDSFGLCEKPYKFYDYNF